MLKFLKSNKKSYSDRQKKKLKKSFFKIKKRQFGLTLIQRFEL